MHEKINYKYFPPWEKKLANLDQVRGNELILQLLVSFGSVDASESFSRPLPKLAPLSLASFHPRLSRLQDHPSSLQFTELCKVHDSVQVSCEWHSTGMFK